MSEDLLSYHEVEELLETIIANKTFAQIPAREGSKFVMFRHPNTQDTIYSRYIRAKTLEEAKSAGLASKAEMEQTILDKKIFNDEDSARILDLEQKIAGQKRLLQITKIEGRRKPIRESITRFEQEIITLRSKGRELIYMTAESKAEEEALLYLTYAGTYSMEGERYWEDFSAFENEKDMYFRNRVIEEFHKFVRGQPNNVIRFLARHGLWRIRYTAGLKLGGSLFEKGLTDLTTDQLSLLHWSDFYQMIYELMPDDRPEEGVIDDDEALDAHVAALAKKRNEERNAGKAKRRGGKGPKLSAWDRGDDVIITAAHPEYLHMEYSEERIKGAEGAADVEVIAPNSRRARNRAQARRNRRR